MTEPVMTRYPTGVFGLTYRGSMFYWFGCSEKEAHEKLDELNIPKESVKWRENYYDSRYPIQDPRCYKTREYKPSK